MPQEARICPRARSPSDSSRARGSCLSRWPERGPQQAVISCCCRTPRRVTMTSTRGAGGSPVQRRADGHCHFGSKCDGGGAGKPVAMPAASEPGSGAALLVDSVRCATVQLSAAFWRSWRSSPEASPPPGRAVILPGRLP